jgi:hypothetical protein
MIRNLNGAVSAPSNKVKKLRDATPASHNIFLPAPDNHKKIWQSLQLFVALLW